MGNLLTWQRDCDMDFADPDLDIVVWATDYSAELEASLVGVSSDWCGKKVRPQYMRYRHPTVRNVMKPMLTRLVCKGGDQAVWTRVDILWLHRRGRTDAVGASGPASTLTHKSQEVEATSEGTVSYVPRSNRWWLGVYEHKSVGYFYYDPYKLVRADVLSVESLVPDNTTHWLMQQYGHSWRVRAGGSAHSWRQRISLMPPTVLVSELKYDTEWWVEKPDNGHGLVSITEGELAYRAWDAVPTALLQLPASANVERRCGNLSHSRLDIRMMPSDWAVQRQEIGQAWRDISHVLTKIKAWHHIDWTTLIAWERDCDFNFRTRELVVVVSAANYTSTLENELVAIGRSACPTKPKVEYIRQEKPRDKRYTAPLETRVTCNDGSVGIRILWLHERAGDKGGSEFWWIGFKPTWQVNYITYKPYNLVTADVFGVASYVPLDVEGHLNEVFAKGWADSDSYGKSVPMESLMRSSISAKLSEDHLSLVEWRKAEKGR